MSFWEASSRRTEFGISCTWLALRRPIARPHVGSDARRATGASSHRRTAEPFIRAPPHRSSSLVPRDSDRRSRFPPSLGRRRGRDRLDGRAMVGDRCLPRRSVAGHRPLGQAPVEKQYCCRRGSQPKGTSASRSQVGRKDTDRSRRPCQVGTTDRTLSDSERPGLASAIGHAMTPLDLGGTCESGASAKAVQMVRGSAPVQSRMNPVSLVRMPYRPSRPRPLR